MGSPHAVTLRYVARVVDPLTLLARALLAFGALVVVPLGRSVVGLSHARTRRLATLGAGALAAGLTPWSAYAPTLRALSAAPWLAWAGYASLEVGAATFRARGAKRDLPALMCVLAHVYLLVGAAWAFAYQAGMVVLGFGGTAALLTANHFHYAGFGACTMVAALGGAAPPALVRHDTWTFRGAALITGSSVALLAIGITWSRTLERIAAWVLLGGLVLLLINLGRGLHARGVRRNPTAAAFAGLAILSSLTAGGLAAHYAMRGFAALDERSLARMLQVHAVCNAMGFILCGLLAIAALRSRAAATAARSAPTSRQ